VRRQHEARLGEQRMIRRQRLGVEYVEPCAKTPGAESLVRVKNISVSR